MNLKEQLQHDLTDAMRARDEQRKTVLRMALSAIQLAEVEQRRDLDDAAVLVVLRKELHQYEDALASIRQAERDDMLAEATAQLAILQSYLPELMDDDAIKRVAQEAIAEVQAASPSDMGKVMQVLMPRVKGKADGRVVSQIVRELLSA
jgi:uncharacterized protein YqeY